MLNSIHDTPGIQRIKFVTNFPKDMTTDLLEAVRDLPKVAHYLHVPLQSGCDDVLARMKRGYTTTDYREMMDRIHTIIPDCAVSSDFIVGFCGESEESFKRAWRPSASTASKTVSSSSTPPPRHESVRPVPGRHPGGRQETPE
ncbi:MAG: radical SAM protein [Planctomycetaceae bacterium]